MYPNVDIVEIKGVIYKRDIDHYVVNINSDKYLTISLSTEQSNSKKNAKLAIWGIDGTVLISDHAETNKWTGKIPLTEDYYITVIPTFPYYRKIKYTLKLKFYQKQKSKHVNICKLFSDPFIYCNEVKNIDIPNKQYIGPKLPNIIIANVRKVLKISQHASIDWIKNGIYWRCMNNNVMICFKGANIPCMSKANTNSTPTNEMLEFCKQHANNSIIPVYITGHNNIYEWRCENRIPKICRQIYHTDRRGFISEFWYSLEKNIEVSK